MLLQLNFMLDDHEFGESLSKEQNAMNKTQGIFITGMVHRLYLGNVLLVCLMIRLRLQNSETMEK